MEFDVYYYNPNSKEEPYPQMKTISSEENLVDFLFMLHTDPSFQEVSRESEYKITVHPHLQEDTLALNLETHEIRRVMHVDKDKVILYNNDDLKSSGQKYGYIPIIREEWNRDKVIPVDMSKLKNFGCFYYGSPLGVHPKYHEVAWKAMCDW